MRHPDDREHLHGGGLRPVQSVTSAPESAAHDQSLRVRRYLLTMGIRVVCGAAAIFTSGWVRWTLVAMAVVLPYIAVVMANAVGPKQGGTLAPVDQPIRALPSAPERAAVDDRPLHGSIVDDD